MVQEAQAKASHTEKLMNKFAKIYTPLVLITALLVFAIPAILAELKVLFKLLYRRRLFQAFQMFSLCCFKHVSLSIDMSRCELTCLGIN